MSEIKYYVTEEQYDFWAGEECQSLVEAKDRARDTALENCDCVYYVVKVKITPLYSIVMETNEEDLDDDDD